MSIYQLDKNIDKEAAYFTNNDPLDFYNPNDLIGRKAYTAVNHALSDSLRGLDTYVPSIVITLPQSVGQSILDKSRECEKNNEEFASYVMEMM